MVGRPESDHTTFDAKSDILCFICHGSYNSELRLFLWNLSRYESDVEKYYILTKVLL